jgi:hypothetical protein
MLLFSLKLYTNVQLFTNYIYYIELKYNIYKLIYRIVLHGEIFKVTQL